MALLVVRTYFIAFLTCIHLLADYLLHHRKHCLKLLLLLLGKPVKLIFKFFLLLKRITSDRLWKWILMLQALRNRQGLSNRFLLLMLLSWSEASECARHLLLELVKLLYWLDKTLTKRWSLVILCSSEGRLLREVLHRLRSLGIALCLILLRFRSLGIALSLVTLTLLRVLFLHTLHLGSLGYRLWAHLSHLESLQTRPERALTRWHPKILPKSKFMLRWLNGCHDGRLVLLLSVLVLLMGFLLCHRLLRLVAFRLGFIALRFLRGWVLLLLVKACSPHLI